MFVCAFVQGQEACGDGGVLKDGLHRSVRWPTTLLSEGGGHQK